MVQRVCCPGKEPGSVAPSSATGTFSTTPQRSDSGQDACAEAGDRLRQQVKRGWERTLQRQVWKRHDDQVMALGWKTRMGEGKDVGLSSARWLVLSDQPYD
jgi:hypothetical protein